MYQRPPQIYFWLGDVISKVGKATFTSKPHVPGPRKNVSTSPSSTFGLVTLYQKLAKPLLLQNPLERNSKKRINVPQLYFWLGDVISKVGNATFTSQPHGPEPPYSLTPLSFSQWTAGLPNVIRPVAVHFSSF